MCFSIVIVIIVLLLTNTDFFHYRPSLISLLLPTRPGPFSGEFGSHAWTIRPTPLGNSACHLVKSDCLSFIIKLLINNEFTLHILHNLFDSGK